MAQDQDSKIPEGSSRASRTGPAPGEKTLGGMGECTRANGLRLAEICSADRTLVTRATPARGGESGPPAGLEIERAASEHRTRGAATCTLSGDS
jgi:hypothetical protein